MLNNKGQFSIIAALLVAVVLVGSVAVTYSAIRYSPIQNQPQILSAIDETNLALKQILGFTVGYYGSVLQVTGNSSYAQTLANNYLDSGLQNIADNNPAWGASFNVANLALCTCWFTNSSYSQANLNVTYDLTGLGISGIAYSASCQLNVTINPQTYNNEISLTVVQDGNTPVVGLSVTNFKFYLYQYSNLTWAMVNPTDEPVSSSNGTYTIDVPSGINPQSYSIQVQDSRGIAVAASSFSHYTGSLAFNCTTVSGGDYVDQYNSSVDSVADLGSHSNFTAQQYGPDNIFDTLTSGFNGYQPQNYYPTGFNLLGSTMNVSGTFPTDLQSVNGAYVTYEAYPTAYTSGQYAAIGYDSSSGTTLTTAATSIQWQHTTGIGNNRILIVSVDVDNSGGTPTTVSGVTYGVTPLTQAATTLCSTSPEVRSYIYYLVNPPIGTQTVTARFPVATLAVGGSITYTNVNQTNPMQTSVAANSGTSQSVGLTASGSYNKILYGHLGTYRTSSYSITDGQTSMWSQTGSNQKGVGSEKTVTSGSVTLSWTTSKTVSWTAIAVLLQPTQRPSQYTCQVEFTGTSNTNSWQSLLWTIDCLANTTNVNLNSQLYNWQTGYPASGDGENSTIIGTSSQIIQQKITDNPAAFKDVLGEWKLEFTATATTSSPFTVSLDMAQYQPSSTIYALNLEEQWTNVNTTYLNSHPVLCINIGTSAPAGLAVDAWNGGSWQTLSNSIVSGWNNLSVSSYLTSPNFTIRFRVGNNTVQSSWQIDAALLRPESDQELFMALQNPSATVAVELLQNGTMVWLGQNLQLTTQTIPVPPVPVKSIHINETIDGVNQQVPFQIEDWASSYTVPLGLTANTTVFSNRQMIVFLVNTHVSDFTVWWNGSDQAVQTPLAYTNTYFTGDNPSNGVLTNGQLSMQISGTGQQFSVTATNGPSTSTTNFMTVNNQACTCGAGAAYVIYDGVVRDIIQQEAEWSNGITNCPNVYANMVLTLPANATYFTYQLSFMFLDSQQTRTISSLTPLSVSSSIGTLQSENGTANGDPIVAAGTQTLSNITGTWQHHWSQFTDGINGAGIMFTDQANQMLYTFDTSTSATGAIVANAATPSISLMPITLNPVSFQNALDVTWFGAVATFDASSVPIYGGLGEPGLWILAEMPPTITVNVGN